MIIFLKYLIKKGDRILMEIAILDDDKQFILILHTMIDEVLNGKTYKVTEFTDPNVFIQYAKRNIISIVFIDYEMSMNAIEVRSKVNNTETIWIMVTSHKHIATEVKGKGFYNFIHKPDLHLLLYFTLNSAWERASKSSEYFVFKSDRKQLKIKYSNIYCVQSNHNDLYIMKQRHEHSDDYVERLRVSLSKYKEQLIEHGFVAIKTNTYVNLLHIEYAESEYVVMDDGTKHLVYGNHYKILKERLLDYE